MSDDARTIAFRLIEEGINTGNLEVLEDLVAPDMREHQSFGPGHPDGPAGVAAVITSLRRAYSDFQMTIEDHAVAGDVVWMRLTATGTNDGPFMGNAPTGRSVRIDVFDTVRVRDGRIVEHWGVPDRLGALLQLGLVQPPAGRG